MRIREGRPEERETFFMMGYDTWNDGRSVSDYLEALRPVPRYAQATWYVLEIEGTKVAALALYRSGLKLPAECWGVGSVATVPEHRRNGYAALLMQHVVELAEAESVRGVYLFSGVGTDYYRQFGFECVSAAQAEGQDPCMVLALRDVDELMGVMPEFF